MSLVFNHAIQLHVYICIFLLCMHMKIWTFHMFAQFHNYTQQNMQTHRWHRTLRQFCKACSLCLRDTCAASCPHDLGLSGCPRCCAKLICKLQELLLLCKEIHILIEQHVHTPSFQVLISSLNMPDFCEHAWNHMPSEQLKRSKLCAAWAYMIS
jgi:hypothetical protein